MFKLIQIIVFFHISSFFILLTNSKYISTENDDLYSKISKIRERRGLLDVNLDVAVNPSEGILSNSVTNLLKPKKDTDSSVETQTTTTTTEVTPVLSNRNSYEPKCGRKIVIHTELITSGFATKPGDWPWHAALYKLKTTGSNQQYICGGSLVSETRVITAAHCVIENTDVILPERLFVILGKYNLAGGDVGSQEKRVFDIVVHDDFSRTTMANDIAILKLSSKVKYSNYVQPICLWGTESTDKSTIVDLFGTVVGWGFTEENKISEQLKRADMPVIPDVDCIKSNPLFFSKFVTEFTFCAGLRNGTSACNGDSGGGMYFSRKGEDGENLWYLRGIVSLSVARQDRNSCDPSEFTVYTDAAKFDNFISNNL